MPICILSTKVYICNFTCITYRSIVNLSLYTKTCDIIPLWVYVYIYIYIYTCKHNKNDYGHNDSTSINQCMMNNIMKNAS